MTSREEYIETKLRMNALSIQQETEALMRNGMNKQSAEETAKAKFVADLSANDPVLRNIGNHR